MSFCTVGTNPRRKAMHKTILFPTDFTVGSLNVVRSVLTRTGESDTRRIILLHGYSPGDSITDLLFASRTAWLRSLSNPAFVEACAVIRNKFKSRITAMGVELFTGHAQAAFNSFLEARGVNEIHIPHDHRLELPARRSFDLLPFIARTNLVVAKEQHRPVGQPIPEKGMVAEVFRDGMVLH